MSDSRLIVVEHNIKDKVEWAKTIEKFSEMAKADDMNIDKWINDPTWKGAKTLLTLRDADDDFCFCIGEVPNSTSLEEFQTFIDEFFPCSANKAFEVKESYGTQKLNPRDYAREFIQSSKGNAHPGFIDAPKLYFVHHDIYNFDEWDEKMNGGMSAALSKCSNPSETHKVFEDGYDAVFAMFLGDGKKVTACLWSSTEDKSQEDFQTMVDGFTQGLSKNTVHPIDSKLSWGVLNLGNDVWAQAALPWARAETTKRAKLASVQMETGTAYPISQ